MYLLNIWVHYSGIKSVYFLGDGKGMVERRIIGGPEVIPHSLPYHVGLSCRSNFNEAFCGGSLISPSFVLTGEWLMTGELKVVGINTIALCSD